MTLLAIAAGCGSQGGESKDAGDGLGAAAVDASIVVLTGAPSVCPGITSFSIDSAELTPGQVAHLDVLTVGPQPSFIRWAVDPAAAGSFSDIESAHPTFRCAGPGVATVSVKVGVTAPGRGNVCEGVAYTSYASAMHCEP